MIPGAAVRLASYPDAMNLQEHDQWDDMKVWLSQSDVEKLLDRADGTQQRLAFALGARCGLRPHEVLDVTSTRSHRRERKKVA